VRVVATYRDLLANRNLTRLLGGEFVSAIGDWLYIVALLVVIYAETGDPLILGLFGAVRTLPYIVLSVPAGLVADRFDRRLVLLVTDLSRGACMLGMAAVLAMGGPIWVLIAFSVTAAAFSTFFYPAIGAYIPNLVENERQLGPANSAWASLDNLGFVVGPVLGGLLVAAGGTELAFVVNAGTFLVIAAILWRLPPSSNVAAETSAVAEAGVAAQGGPGATPRPSATAPLIGVAVLRFADYAIMGGVGMLTVVLATDILHAGEAATGYLNAAIGVGGVAGAIAAGALVLRRSLRLPVIAGAGVLAIGSALVGVAPGIVVAFVAIVFVSAGHLVMEVMAATLMQRVTTDAVRGRVVGSLMVVETTAEAAGSFALPVLVATFGAFAVMGLSAGLMVLAAGAALALIGGAITRAPSAIEATVARVLRLPLFAGVSNAAVERALDRFMSIEVVAGASVVRQGDPADRFYIIESGEFAVRRTDETGEAHELRRLGRDDVFGELGLLTGAPRSATVLALSHGVVLALEGSEFLELVGRPGAVRGRLLQLYEPDLAPATD
jgi:Major Facilitator Superfamily/Cyclic nucleotide-binding domain